MPNKKIRTEDLLALNARRVHYSSGFTPRVLTETVSWIGFIWLFLEMYGCVDISFRISLVVFVWSFLLLKLYSWYEYHTIRDGVGVVFSYIGELPESASEPLIAEIERRLLELDPTSPSDFQKLFEGAKELGLIEWSETPEEWRSRITRTCNDHTG